MTWLTLWLKKIILLVLLAAFLDLVLPNTSLQRYVKMVMGLIILMTIISPVFALFQLSQDDLALKLDQYQQEMNRPSDAEWKRIAEKLAGQQDRQISAYVHSQVEASIRTRLKEHYGVEAAAIKVIFTEGESAETKLERIEISLGTERRSEADTAVIKPIEPVRIEIDSRSAETASDRPVTAQTKDPLSRRIASDVAEQWGIEADRVLVSREENGGEKQ
ncbi:stage III sporulation protein AF [Brevibacillus ruminantium]|uniref:Stage III sporulation protein AF n=1 Tax=Brevibacillus ruminantium TaxID=2950604 RepID=A0ABY4W9B4_9BACL|nr:stage III sporulation protein AF [Brevibacillus ruminantium]USG63648.1 stage III sporulation protein AF [Brevibacillus ruminantium]